MAATTSRDHDTDLLIVGAGPAGCAAALMAASVGMRSLLIESDALCGKLRHIGAVDNVPGGFTGGPALASAIAEDIERTAPCSVAIGTRVVDVQAGDDAVTATSDSGSRLTAPYAVVATGVGPLGPSDVSWLTVREGCALPTLWGATLEGQAAGPLLVLGADRPLGTFLRTHPDLDAPVLVAHPPEDDYKAEEVRGDPRVTLLPVAALTLQAADGRAVTGTWVRRDGQAARVTAAAAFLNLGSAPGPPAGSLSRDALGYCPPRDQPARILVAGDLRSARFQRIAAAIGSGSEAALCAYYAAQGLGGGDHRPAW
jgi:thioredoxin reductase (NADPH)/alkyl hydroperoxide reductase subunit F